MFFRKILLSSVIVLGAVASAATFADTADQTSDEVVAPSHQNSVYVDAHVGYAQVDWKNFNSSGVMGTASLSYFAPNNNENGGVTGGADTGYNFTNYIAGELGWFYLPEVKGAGTSSGAINTFAASQTAKVHSWLAYGAAKLSVPMVSHVQLFGKVGAAYRSLKYTVPSGGNAGFVNLTKDGGYWSPIFAAGMQYTRNGWILGMQYVHILSNTDQNGNVARDGTVVNGGPDAAPAVNMYTAYLGYQYAA